MKLYQYPGGSGISSVSSPCVKVELALRRVGADYDTVYLRSPREVRRFSATRRLPVLEIDGRRIPDSVAILDELEKRFPDAGLSPAEPDARLRDRLWEHFATDTMYWVGFWLRWVDPEVSERFFSALFGRMAAPGRFAVRRFFLPKQRQRIGLVGHGGKSAERIHVEFSRALEMVEQGLEGGPFLQGRATPGRGDLACAGLLVQVGFRGSMPDQMAEVQRHPAIIEHLRAVYQACSMELPRWLREAGGYRRMA